jgi:membrane protease YdiL (CAAX protease family)
MPPAARRFWLDPLFLAALAAALVYWLLLSQIAATGDLGWPMRDPLRFAYPALIYPVVEELVFRGLLQDLAHRHLRPWSLGPVSHANLITSVAFTALHFVNHTPLWATAVFVPSLIFGFFKDRTGGLAAPIVLHAFYNSGYFWLFGA